MKHHLNACYGDITRLTLCRISELFFEGPYRSDLSKNLLIMPHLMLSLDACQDFLLIYISTQVRFDCGFAL